VRRLEFLFFPIVLGRSGRAELTEKDEVPGAMTRSDDVRRGNRRRILAAIRRQGPISRRDICERTGLSAATVSAITSDLNSEGVLIDRSRPDMAAGIRGRPTTDLCVNPEAGIVGTMNFQLNAVSAAIVDYAGAPLAETALKIDTHKASAAALRKALLQCMSGALAKSGMAAALRGIAIGVQGVTDVGGTTMLWSPIMRQRNLPIQSWLESEFSVPVRVCNDCDLMAHALNWNEPDRYGANFAAILFAHGVGMGLFLRGAPVTGTRTSGFEFGHMIHSPDGALCRCGSRGCIEAYAGDYAIKRRANGQDETSPPAASVAPGEIAGIVEAARSGDKDARAAIDAAGRAIGTGLASVYALLDPFPVALIGSGTVTGDLLSRSLQDAIGQSIAVRNSGDRPDAAAFGVTIDYLRDDHPLVQQGCVIRALLALDGEFADAGDGSQWRLSGT